MHYDILLTDLNEYCTVLVNDKLHIVLEGFGTASGRHRDHMLWPYCQKCIKKPHRHPQIKRNIISKPYLPNPNLFNAQIGIQSPVT